MEGVDKQPHIKLSAGQIRPVVLTCGDPARAQLIASMCERSEELAYNREYRSFNCTQDGVEFTVLSHGVGSAGAGICFEEAIKVGAKVIIRVGTCGSLRPADLMQGDVVVCHSAAREDGLTNALVPAGYPAISDPEVFQTLQKHSKGHTGVTSGMTLTSDVFFPGTMPNTLPLWAKSGVDIVEMEVATLFIVASIRGIKAGAICTVDGSPFAWKEGNYDPTGAKTKEGVTKSISIALKAVVDLSKQIMVSGQIPSKLTGTNEIATAAALTQENR